MAIHTLQNPALSVGETPSRVDFVGQGLDRSFESGLSGCPSLGQIADGQSAGIELIQLGNVVQPLIGPRRQGGLLLESGFELDEITALTIPSAQQNATQTSGCRAG